MTLGARTAGPGIPVRDRCGSANHHAGADGEMAKDNVADRATSVVKIKIDTPWAGLGERGLEIVALVVDRRVIAEQLTALGDLCRSARNPACSQTREFCDRPDRRSYRAGRGRHHNSIAGARPANVEQPEIGGDAVETG